MAAPFPFDQLVLPSPNLTKNSFKYSCRYDDNHAPNLIFIVEVQLILTYILVSFLYFCIMFVRKLFCPKFLKSVQKLLSEVVFWKFSVRKCSMWMKFLEFSVFRSKRLRTVVRIKRTCVPDLFLSSGVEHRLNKTSSSFRYQIENPFLLEVFTS